MAPIMDSADELMTKNPVVGLDPKRRQQSRVGNIQRRHRLGTNPELCGVGSSSRLRCPPRKQWARVVSGPSVGNDKSMYK